MQIRVNNQLITLYSPCTLKQLLLQLDQTSAGLALALNRRIICRSEWAEQTLTEGDEVILIRATAGG